MQRKHLLCALFALTFGAVLVVSRIANPEPSGTCAGVLPTASTTRPHGVNRNPPNLLYPAAQLALATFQHAQFFNAASSFVTVVKSKERQVYNQSNFASGKVLCGIFARYVS